jgi:ubiquitin C-terminal hydrolase
MLCTSFKLLIEKLWPDNYVNSYLSSYGSIGSNNTYSNKKNDSYAPKDFKTKISTMNELFMGVAANDAKDLVNFLIMTLHAELNTAEKKNLNTNAINQDQRNQQLMFKLFTQDFVNSNKSIISDLFYGVNYNIVHCNGCGSTAYNYQTYFFFVFPLEEVRIFKSQNNYNNNFNYNMNFNNNEVNIYDCFLYDQRINYMMGENAMYCNICKRQCNSQMCTLLAFGPEIIIIILNRGQGAEFKVKVNFQEQLNLYSFIEYKDTGVNYQLIGVITHLGGNDMSGHFIAYCKNPISNSWYQYNDSIVNEVNQANFKAEVIDYAMPYLLFYQKVGK